MNLLQALGGTYLNFVDEIALEKGVGFFLALSVDAVVGIEEPIQKFHRPIVGKMLGKLHHAVAVEGVGQSFFAVGS